ncbi:MAG: hypothetical protein WCO00_01625 [Rhodospirillaceae bacterium]
MADNEHGAADKRGWPDMRTLRWPPEGIEVDPEAKATPVAVVPPVEFAADPAGSGAFVPVPVPDRLRTPETVVAPPAETPPADGAIAVVGAEAQGALILSEVRSLRQAVDALTATVRALSDSGRVGAGGGGGGPARSVSDHQGRQEIQEYFMRHPGRTVYPKEIADALNLPVLKVAELCEALAQRGQISRNLGG